MAAHHFKQNPRHIGGDFVFNDYCSVVFSNEFCLTEIFEMLHFQ